ncbi:membrane-bound lytic murein transglycosylase MltF [Ectothiorhodospiraceae bacterium WFHF3C12]|nr:membrane-bound lytic murein transglycosylase MltF [Ectothiorhodospiraceae bacterium WFHF3C12]
MFRRILTILAVVVLAGCEDRPEAGVAQGRSLEAIKASGKLVVLTRNAPTTWYIGRDGEPTGPEYDMVEAFAGHLDVEPEFRELATVDAILTALANDEGDLAAAGLTRTDARAKQFRFGAAYQDVTQQVVCRRDNVQPESIDALTGLDIKVIANSSYSERLARLKADGHPRLSWQETEQADTETLLREVWNRALDCTVADSTIVDINRRYFPELIAPMNLGRSQSLAWALPAGAEELEAAVDGWLGAFRESGRLAALQERYFGFFEVFDYVDTRVYIRRIDERFPKFRSHFGKAASEYGLAPMLLAAQGYQESHWNPSARSPTGVRGIMMLTRNTAQAMGVDNRLDPRQSIFGGAKYLARMKKRFVEAVTEPDRTWLALAAYNVGRAHMHDAQTLAREQGLSPHLWRDIKQVLPLLSEKRYYQDLKYGYARGMEPVRYVQRIREYQHILENELR